MGNVLKMARWRVDIIRKRAEHLGTVEAANANEAIREAIKRFEILPERQQPNCGRRRWARTRISWQLREQGSFRLRMC